MQVYALYEDGNYDDAIIAADRFIQLHPGNRDIAYAYYLKAICYYMQIVDVGRDQKMTELALQGARRCRAPLPRQQICPRRQAEARLHPRSSGRQGDGDRPLLPEAAANIWRR